jgi:hypothetical protein
VLDFLGVRKIAIGGVFAVEKPGGGLGAGVESLDRRRSEQMEANDEIGERCGLECNRIGEKAGAGRDGDRGLSTEKHLLLAACDDGAGAGGDGTCYIDGVDDEGLGAERVREMQANLAAADGEMYDLADGGVGEAGGVDAGLVVLRLGGHHGGGPGCGPNAGGLLRADGQSQGEAKGCEQFH